MSDVTIPEDVMQAADAAWNELTSLSALGREDETLVIARAILAERERCAKIAEGDAKTFDFQAALADLRDMEVGLHSARLGIAQAIRSSHD